ncbi:MAG: ribonuclease P [Candidatus Micrarchaeota archaeon]|nr:ribonuclease P [Candidatus Micrarchaeota archaeon]
MAKKRLSARRREARGSIAAERVHILLRIAADMHRKGDDEAARQCCALARKIMLRYRVRMGKEAGMRYCKRCFMPWIIGDTVKVRLDSGRRCVEYTCVCGHRKRYGYVKRGV